ncbi:Chitin synthase 1 [Zancudomyces culisetae]|uniref:chitin synthase n=1 Tax=Zancudomyces culisetae TaxID=1213189 RepID=A0A1R1PU18_ZANCU|nr:Chitin synthase 1 [Zancudomyces culisetae]OMH84604.1 Chitin synthase 1 [Zancudomyces culisetae]|eukprot:OMH84486.1 Chitin synthase 1 [Zancudomyces culisetae]
MNDKRSRENAYGNEGGRGGDNERMNNYELLERIRQQRQQQQQQQSPVGSLTPPQHTQSNSQGYRGGDERVFNARPPPIPTQLSQQMQQPQGYDTMGGRSEDASAVGSIAGERYRRLNPSEADRIYNQGHGGYDEGRSQQSYGYNNQQHEMDMYQQNQQNQGYQEEIEMHENTYDDGRYQYTGGDIGDHQGYYEGDGHFAKNEEYYGSGMGEEGYYGQGDVPILGGGKPLPVPMRPRDAEKRSEPSIHDVQLRVAQPVSTPELQSNDLLEKSGRVLDPRHMPEVDPQLSQLYDISEAPPVDSRLYSAYKEQRMRHLKQVELTSGNLVLDCPVADKVLMAGKYKTGQEFTHMRYTACTCDPNEFMTEKYTLRPVMYGRQTEMFTVLTMYNEGPDLFGRTFKAVVKNITHLQTRTRSRTWGADAWKKCVVCVVADGRTKVNRKVLEILGCMGVYQEGVMQNSVSGRPVTAHIFEYTTQICIDSEMNFLGPERGYVPVQVLFCLKEKNAKKINSHRWFFNAFSPLLQPNICVLIDVGTKPTGTSIYHLWKAFDKDAKVAGACGEICVDTGNNSCDLWNMLVAAQNFEYKMSNILDKPLESVLGYISVLPGAFSAYRYSALQNSDATSGPLHSYFKGELMHSGDGSAGGIFEANMYLAEDRILCFELVTKRNCNYVLKYVKSAKAMTDVPDTLPELISQRRRWLNGSFFAMFYAIAHWYRVLNSSHHIFQHFLFFIEFLYQVVNMLFSWFSLANFYLAFYFLAQNVQLADKEKRYKNDPFFGGGTVVTEVIRILYIMSLMMIFVLALGNRPQGSKFIYGFAVTLFALIMIVMTYTVIFSIVRQIQSTNFNDGAVSLIKDSYFRDIVISTASTYGIYLISSIIYLEPWHMVTSLVQYLLWMPSAINILMVYAFCNIHDVSWGTKGDTSVSNDLGHAKVSTKKDGVAVATVNVATDQADINAVYETFLSSLRQPIPKNAEKVKRDAATKRDDANKMFRTNLVLVWTFTNILLVLILSSAWFADHIYGSGSATAQSAAVNPYLSFIFWSVAALAFIRFVGSISYIIGHYLFGP